jgi:hypothetical protein
MLLVGGGTDLGRALSRILDGQRRDDDGDLSPAPRLRAGDDHPGQARIDREDGELPSDLGDADLPGPVTGQGPEFGQHRSSVPHGSGLRRGEEREVEDLLIACGEAEVGHLQDDAGEVRAEDLGIGEFGSGLEVLLRVQADADAFAGAARPTLALVRTRLGDPLDRQPLDPGAVGIARDPGGADIDDVLDSGHGQRGLGHVRGQHDAGAAVRAEDLLLLTGREPGEQRHDLPIAHPRTSAQVVGQRIGGVADLAFAGEEDEDVAGLLGGELIDGGDDAVGLLLHPRLVVARVTGTVDIVVIGFVPERPVADLDRVGPTLDRDDRGVIEVRGERFGIDRRRGDDHLEVRATAEDLFEVAEEEIDVEAAFVRLVDDDDFVVAQQFVAGEFGQQDAIGHHLHPRGVGDLRGEAHLIADGVSEVLVEFVGDAFGHGPGRDPSGLSVTDESVDAETELQADLRQLRGLARPRLTGDDDDLVVPDRLGDLILRGGDRQIVRVGHGDRMGGAGGLEPGATLLVMGCGGLPSLLRAPLLPAPRRPLRVRGRGRRGRCLFCHCASQLSVNAGIRPRRGGCDPDEMGRAGRRLGARRAQAPPPHSGSRAE